MNDLYRNELETKLIELELSKSDLRSICTWFKPKNKEADIVEWCRIFTQELSLKYCYGPEPEEYIINFPSHLIDDLICSIGDIAYSGYRSKIQTRIHAKKILDKIEIKTKIWETKFISLN